MTVHDALVPSPSGTEADALGLEAFATIDRMREALSAQLSGGLSPAALALAFLDWSAHLARPRS
jgi:polyhydroxyalkanoate synthase